MVFEVVDNCIDEAMAGHCSIIQIIINKNGSVSVKDNGRGIPVDTHKKKRYLQHIIMTTLHSVENLMIIRTRFQEATWCRSVCS